MCFDGVCVLSSAINSVPINMNGGLRVVLARSLLLQESIF